MVAAFPKRLKAAILCDFAEENWPSMDLVASVLLEQLQSAHARGIDAVMIRPAFRRRFTRADAMRRSPLMFNADRILNRFIDYPLALAQRRNQFDIFHVTDHSYSHLLHHLPHGRTVVTCHDLDSFRCVLEPAMERRSSAFKLMTRRIVDGLRRAAAVACVSEATREECLRHRLLPVERTTTILNGVSPIFAMDSDPASDHDAERLIGPARPETVEVLHVGSTIPRKRIDILLRVFAGIRERFPAARLIRVSGPFTMTQNTLLLRLGLEQATTVLPFIPMATLAALYRRAALVLVPSEAEGFGLPVIEAMACGATVIASDIPALREIGSDAALFAEAGNADAMVKLALDVLQEQKTDAVDALRRRDRAIANAARFSWTEYARQYAELYQRVAQSN
ncbi:MAG TPA: glycosyltransferase family 1 protein [Candidatus Binataceae bacterium]|nr:glycosyltransferase family 1 protein [Candidatus Binataceae bacterium]